MNLFQSKSLILLFSLIFVSVFINCDNKETEEKQGSDNTEFTASYDWHTFYGGDPENGSPYTQASTIDSGGNLLVAGIAYGAWTGDNSSAPVDAYTQSLSIWVLKLTAQGEYVWHTFVGKTNTLSGYLDLSISSDQFDNIYISGPSAANWTGPQGQAPLNAYHGGNLDGFIIKLDSNGVYQWHTFVGGSSADGIYSIKVNSNGSLYALGDSLLEWDSENGDPPLHISDAPPTNLGVGTSGFLALFILKLDTNGEYQWHTFYGRASTNTFFTGGLALDDVDNIYAVGLSNATWTGDNDLQPLNPISNDTTVVNDIYVLKLNSSGGYQWHTFQDASVTGNGSLRRIKVVLDQYYNPVIGATVNAARLGEANTEPVNAYHGDTDIFILKLTTLGTYQWHSYIGSPASDIFADIIVDSINRVVFTGTADGSWLGPGGTEPLSPFNENRLTNGSITTLNHNGGYAWHTFINGTGRTVSAIGKSLFVSGVDAKHYSLEPDDYILGPDTPDPLHGIDGLFVLKF